MRSRSASEGKAATCTRRWFEDQPRGVLDHSGAICGRVARARSNNEVPRQRERPAVARTYFDIQVGCLECLSELASGVLSRFGEDARISRPVEVTLPVFVRIGVVEAAELEPGGLLRDTEQDGGIPRRMGRLRDRKVQEVRSAAAEHPAGHYIESGMVGVIVGFVTDHHVWVNYLVEKAKHHLDRINMEGQLPIGEIELENVVLFQTEDLSSPTRLLAAHGIVGANDDQEDSAARRGESRDRRAGADGLVIVVRGDDQREKARTLKGWP
jgi:hypothetical protein